MMIEVRGANQSGRSAKRTRLLAGACSAALALACAFPAMAHDYTASTDAQLRQAILDANADPDPTSTITLTANISIGSTLPAATQTLIIDTGAFSTTGMTPVGTVTVIGTVNGTDDPVGLNGQSGLTVGAASVITNYAAVTGGDGSNTSLNALGANVQNGGSLINNGSITGGNSGSGGAQGGHGIQVSNTASVVNSGLIQGGAGQGVAGGDGAFIGVGVSGTQTFTNSGTVRGGNGTTGGYGIEIKFLPVPITNSGTIEGGNGAAAIKSDGPAATIINSGTIRAGAGGTVAMDLSLSALTTLELQAGSNIVGNVIANAGGADKLRFGGSVDSSFNLSKIGAAAQYQNFDIFGKSGTSTWTLTGDLAAGSWWQIDQGTAVFGNGGSALQFGQIDNNGTVVFQRNTAVTVTGPISGTGSVVQNGTGTTTLTGSNSYSGGTVITKGTLSVGSDLNLGNAAGAITINGGTLQWTGSGTIARTINWGANGGGFNITGTSLSLTQPLVGGGALAKSGTGSLLLAGDNTYTGGTTISAGALFIGSGGTTGSILGNVVDNGGLTFNRSDSLTFAGAITGTGTLANVGTGTLTLTGHSSYGGTTTLSAGQILVNAGGTVVSGGATSMTSNNATLAVDGAAPPSPPPRSMRLAPPTARC